jgi:acrylyl-CoA reductase (NADPH)
VLRASGAQLIPAVEELGLEDLPAGEVLVKVSFSGINFKDAMAIGNRGIIRKFPAVPGIDLAGEVVSSEHPEHRAGDQVILTGWGMGERFWGGLSQYARVPGAGLLPLPAGMSARQAMAHGTAGLTAALCVAALRQQGLRPEAGEVLVTGATGGVGSIAVALLAGLGFQVAALTGKADQAGFLHRLGATRIVVRQGFDSPAKPGRFVLEPETYAAAVDTVGGATLAAILARLNYGGSVAACGLVGGVELDSHVFPFILRGVSLLGIDSVRCPNPQRRAAWQTLAESFPAATLDLLTREIRLEQVVEAAAGILAGQALGRLVVNLS